MADLSKTLWSRRGVAVVAVGAASILAACGSSGSKAGDTSPSTLTTAGATTTAGGTSSSASGTPSRKPCDLLTKEIAEATLGVAVGEARQTPGQGNETCSFRATDAGSIAQVYVTTYAAKGTEAGLDAAAAQFKNVHAVEGLGDSARVSLDDHAIGVLKGDFVFAAGLILPGDAQNLTPVTEKQMVDLANAVLARA